MYTRAALLRLSLSVLLAFAGTGAFAAENTIYRSRDAQGNVIFSDRQDEAAEAVRVPRTNTVPLLSTPAESRPDQGDARSADVETGYQTLSIVSPQAGETIVHPTGYMKVEVAVDPPLRARHSLRLLLDGEPAGIPQQGSMELAGLTRGEHTLQLLVADEDGNLVQESAEITVRVQRPGKRGGTHRPLRR